MISSLPALLRQDSFRNADLRRLNLMCSTEAQVINAVCVGAGDAFINRYWPILRRYVALGHLKLLVADEKPLIQVSQESVEKATISGETEAAESLRRQYEELGDWTTANGDVLFIDVTNKDDRKWYRHVRADMVFVLVPDEVHIRVAKDWLKRATLILIEKPYNRDLQEAVEFENDLRFMMNHIGGDVPATWVCPFDHYLAKIHRYVFQSERHQLLDRIGGLTEIEFAILEAGPVELWRAESLRAGMIYDLFSHVLAILSVQLDLSTFRYDRVKSIRVARHKSCPPGFSSDTFTELDLSMEDYQRRRVQVRGAVGKGVGSKDEKFVTLLGSTGLIKCDLDPKGSSQIVMTENRGSGRERPIYEVGKGHPEFLEALMHGRWVDEPIGGLNGETAIQTLRIMNSIREKIPSSLYEYDVGTARKDIVGTRLVF